VTRWFFSPTTVVIALLIAALYLLGSTEALDRAVLNALYRLRGARPHAGDIVIVGIDEAFAQAYAFRIGELDRRFYTQAITNLTMAGAHVIGIDLFFPERSVGIVSGTVWATMSPTILCSRMYPEECWHSSQVPSVRHPGWSLATASFRHLH
jgi:hypothetical protein